MRVVNLFGTADAWTFRRFGEACAELGVKPRHVLHVGGHLGQEYRHYKAAGVEQVTYLEPTPGNADHLRTTYPAATVIEAAAGRESGTAVLHLRGGDGCWNTLSPAARTVDHAGAGGQVEVKVVTIAEVQAGADALVVDTQGTEVDALSGADLSQVRLVVVETATGHPEAAHIDDVNAHMAGRGWDPALAWYHERSGPYVGFADVFYLRRP